MARFISPVEVFYDLSGQPLDDGYVYFGSPDLNPITNPITVYWDAALTQPAAQPLRTSAGYIMRSGSPAGIYASGSYSILIHDKNGSLVINGTDSSDFDISTQILATLAASGGAALIGNISPLTGAVARTLQAAANDRILVTQFPNVDPTGATSSSAGFALAVAAMPNPSELTFPKGIYLLTTDFLIPYAGVNGSGKTLNFEGCIFRAGANNITLLHWSDSKGTAKGSVQFEAGAFTGCSGFRVTPENEASTAVLANQNFNDFSGLVARYTGGLAETFVMQTGPRVTGTDSGCWFNNIGPIYVTSCLRGPWLKDGNLGANSGINSNHFSYVCINGSTNTGFQIDSGGGNEIDILLLENITSGSSPNASPTGLIVTNTMANGNSNNDNWIKSYHQENCTVKAVIGNSSTRIGASDNDILNANGQITPYTEQYRKAFPQKGTLIASIYNAVAAVTNIRALWLFDVFGNEVQVTDRSTVGHNLDFRDAALASQAASLWGPRIDGNAFGLTYGDESHLWNTPNNSDFSFGNGATDTSFSIVTLIYPTLATACEVVAKDDVTTAATKREYSLALGTGGDIQMILFDDSAGSNIGRTSPVASITANTLQVLTATYSGSGLSSGIKIYVNNTQVDNANSAAGVYTAMEALTAKPAGYRISAAGVPERFYKGQLYFTMITGDELTAAQVRQLSYLLRSYAGASLS